MPGRVHLHRALTPSTGEQAPPAPEALIEEVVALARRAGEETLRWFRSVELVVEAKEDGTPVTEADRAAEQLVREHIAAHHPDDAVVGEEYGTTAGTSGRRWIIDPIDGTKAFTHGVPLYTNLLAVEDVHGPLVGVVNVPALDEVVSAGRGRGCFHNGHRTHVSTHGELAGAYVTTSAYEDWTDTMFGAARANGMHMRTWGDGYGYVLVATGRVEAMVDTVAAPWDLAPMPLVVGEAGGRFTDLAGRPVIDGGSGVATNGVLHDRVLSALGGGTAPARGLPRA